MPLSDIFAAIRWWAALMIIGAAATPLTFYLFRRLADRGYAFAKLVGLLIVSYLFWLLGSLGILGNNLGDILFALLVLISLSAWATKRLATTRLETRDYETNPQSPISNLQSWLQDNKTQIVVTELLFAVLFASWVWVRAQNPAITATEKPMEFAFLNGIGRSSAFPPLDPWLSGFAISYYYFGYVMASVLARLAAVAEPVAFNLTIAWLVAGTGTAVFGLVYNLINRGGAENAEKRTVVFGLIAAIALPLAGNLEVGLEVMHASGVGSDQFWQWLDVRDLDAPAVVAETPRYETSSWWWWRSSRVIHEYHLSGRAEDGLEPIAEFPGFSFVLGDMHPHVLALPFAFLSLATAYLWYLFGAGEQVSKGAGESMSAPLLPRPPAPLLTFTALLLGGLSFLNTWDVLIHLFMVLGAVFVGRWQAQGWHKRLWREVGLLALWLIIPAIVLYLPFYLGFRSQAGAPYLLPMLMRPTRLTHFLIIFGMPLFSITILVAVLAVRQRFRYWRLGLATAVSLLLVLILLMLLLGWVIAASPEGAGRIIPLADEIGLTLPARPDGLAFGWGITAVFTLLPAILTAKLTYSALTLFLLALLAFIVMIWTNDAENSSSAHLLAGSPAPLPFVLLLVAAATLLTLGPEFVYLRDNFGFRLNTIFKFYYQAWAMFGVAALFGLDYLWREAKAAGFVAATGYGLALAAALMFPYFGINSRAAEFRGPAAAETRQPATLNGLAQVERHNPDEYAATMWLRDNIEGAPTIVEAVGGQYSGYGRIAANTGLPTILGWAGHEYQWRGNTPEPGWRDPAVRAIYESTNWEETAVLLNRYNVEYIIVGGLERNTYNIPEGKFTGLDIAFSSGNIVIYHWQPK
ncbi:MAG: hypothetical protein GY803_22675 [Chloroflexi bacterium]|nr:hypothetical protein [Chloroflexota bacterium]